MKKGRSNQTGGAFQARVESMLKGYRRAGVARIHKQDPPVRLVGTGKFRKTIFQQNPWLDYGGVWTAANGRAIHLEAKSTEGELLPLNRSGGITENQLTTLAGWRNAGAATGLLWWHGTELRVVSGGQLVDAARMGHKSLKWRHARPCRRGEGLVEFDFLADLAEQLEIVMVGQN